MEIPHAPQFFLQPALRRSSAGYAESASADVSPGAERFVDRLGGEHAAFDRRVNALQPLRIQQARGIADDQPAVHVAARHRIPAAVGNRLRAIADQLAALQNPLHERMRFEFLKRFVRIEERIRVFQADDHAQRNAIVAQAVNPAAAVKIRSQRPAKHVRHEARSRSSRAARPTIP